MIRLAIRTIQPAELRPLCPEDARGRDKKFFHRPLKPKGGFLIFCLPPGGGSGALGAR